MVRKRGFRIGIDTGGTFTDVVGVRVDTGEVFTTKTPTTPEDYSEGLLRGVRKILALAKARGRDVLGVYHGTTVATNTILERRFEGLGLVVNRGFRHLLSVGPQKASAGFADAYFAPKLEPLVPLERVQEVGGRLGPQGEEPEPLDEEGVRRAARFFRQEGVGAVGVCLLHSYANPRHEERVKAIFAEECPEIFLSISSEVLPEPVEYERCVTTLMDACIKPPVKRYLERGAGRVEEAVGAVPFLVMKSNGGVASVPEVVQRPIATVLSGPAAGALSAAFMGRLSGYPNLITLDGGGTSTDVAVVEGGEARRTTRGSLGDSPLKAPMVDVVSIGTGGGSIAWKSPEGRLHVGPRSAGAEPGPVCYGKGGREPTLTDANLVLARSPLSLAGGEVALNKALAMRAMRSLAREFGMDPLEMAAGVVEIAAWNQAHAIRRATVRRGLDPRDYALMAFGGSGPLQAGIVADVLAIDTLIVPPSPGTLSAFGLEVVDIQNDYVVPHRQVEGALDAEALTLVFQELERRAVEDLVREGVPPHRQVLRRSMDLRYRGEGQELSMDVPGGYLGPQSLAETLEAFHRRYLRLFTYNFRGLHPVEVASLRLTAVGLTDPPELPILPAGGADPADAYKGARLVWFRECGGFVDTPVFQRERLLDGHRIEGPAVVESFGSTAVIFPTQQARVDRYGQLIVEFRGPKL
ncbi:MAG: hydantoinase/oxoprolinase family protein [Nitrospinota bacterium]